MLSMPPLPYPSGALEPFLSTESVRVHYMFHQAELVRKLNSLLLPVSLGASVECEPRRPRVHDRKPKCYRNGGQQLSLERIVLSSHEDSEVYSIAAQVRLHVTA